MMARRRSFSAPARRRTGWEEGPGGQAVVAVSTTSSLIIGSGVAALTDGLTVVRSRGMINLVLNAASASMDGFGYAFGLCVVTSDAFAVGITAVPKPIDDSDWDGWFWHSFGFLFSHAALTSTGTGPFVENIEIDSKAMRKVGINDTVTLVGQFVEAGTAVINIHADSRLLTKLP